MTSSAPLLPAYAVVYISPTEVPTLEMLTILPERSVGRYGIALESSRIQVERLVIRFRGQMFQGFGVADAGVICDDVDLELPFAGRECRFRDVDELVWAVDGGKICLCRCCCYTVL